MTLRIGFIGAGRMAHLHANLLQGEADVQIAAASDNGSGRALDFTARYGAAAFSDYRQLLDAQPLDAVYICTPTPTHAAIGLECVERGLHVFAEKPLDLDLKAGLRFVRAAQARGLLAMNCFHWRYTAAYRRAEAIIADNPVALVNLRWYWTRPPIRWMWDRSRAGGQIVDQNIHLLDVARGLAGEITTVFAAYNQRQANFEPDFLNWDGYALTLRHARGAVGVCAGTYALFPEIQQRPTADFALRDQLVRITDEELALFTPDGVQTWPNREPLHLGINRAFVAALRSGDFNVRAPLADGLRTTAVTLAANRSAETGHPVEIDAFLAESTGEEVEGP